MKKTEIKELRNDELLLYYATILGARNTTDSEFKKVESEILARMAINQSIIVNNLCTKDEVEVK